METTDMEDVSEFTLIEVSILHLNSCIYSEFISNGVVVVDQVFAAVEEADRVFAAVEEADLFLFWVHMKASKKITDAKLAKYFQAVLKEFQKAQRLSAERETAYTPFVPQAAFPSSDPASEMDASSGKSQEQRALLVDSKRQVLHFMLFVSRQIAKFQGKVAKLHVIRSLLVFLTLSRLKVDNLYFLIIPLWSSTVIEKSVTRLF
ncbi:hypothetical protein L6452_38713 [Arctium lappa]|uniref:Uncharacterized protein n=1 Tax=Arctium lappa TaxID=4217 RepID=A0ACB8XS08_ARCLA|nr:hypothetical protein L6452_38713 [Arctium lappa]